MPDASPKPPIQRVLVITAHPDDSEFGAGGTIAKLTREGLQVSYCIVTNGNKGSGDRSMTPERLARIREEEQRNAARVLGVETVDFLGFPDCEVEDTRESRLAVTAAIRRHRPDRLIIQNPHRTKNLGASHRDHRTVAGIAIDCVYPLARDHMAFPELLAQGLEPHKVREVYLMWWEIRSWSWTSPTRSISRSRRWPATRASSRISPRWSSAFASAAPSSASPGATRTPRPSI